MLYLKSKRLFVHFRREKKNEMYATDTLDLMYGLNQIQTSFSFSLSPFDIDTQTASAILFDNEEIEKNEFNRRALHFLVRTR